MDEESHGIQGHAAVRHFSLPRHAKRPSDGLKACQNGEVFCCPTPNRAKRGHAPENLASKRVRSNTGSNGNLNLAQAPENSTRSRPRKHIVKHDSKSAVKIAIKPTDGPRFEYIEEAEQHKCG